jgi:peroxiredoxin
MHLHVSSTSAHRQEAKIVLYTYRCDDTRDCTVQFSPPDDEHLGAKHVDA